MTTNDADWVEDVRRWYFNGGRSAVVQPKPLPKTEGEQPEVGYETAHPSLQSKGWAAPVASGFGSLR